MEQTFGDLLQEHSDQGLSDLRFVAWIFVETSIAIYKENSRVMDTRIRMLLRPALISLVILLIPLLAMQFTAEVTWDISDFAIAGVFLFGAAFLFELISACVTVSAYKVAVGVAIASALLLVWTNLAVGLIGNEGNPVNLIYLGVLAVGFTGAILVRLQSKGMARALLATALAQVVATVIAVVLDPRVGVLAINLLFLVLFIVAALLFRRANLQRPETHATA